MSKRPTAASSVTVRLPPRLHDALIKKAQMQTAGNVSKLLRRVVRDATK